MSFANQALSVLYLLDNKGKLSLRVFNVPPEIDSSVARLKLESMKIEIDTLTPRQAKYLKSWS